MRSVFAARKAAHQPVFVGFAMEGFPSRAETPAILLALEAGGADVIELAVPHSDPVADGPTLQLVAQRALSEGGSATSALTSLRQARAAGLAAPVVMFGYYNTFLAYGVERFCADAHAAGADALLCVDLPPEQLQQSPTGPLALVPLVTPTTSDARIASIAAMPGVAFLYCVALLGVTGARAAVSRELPEYMARVRARVAAVPDAPPLVVGFGISSHESFLQVAAHADGVVAASAMLDAVQARSQAQSATEVVRDFAQKLTGRSASLGFPPRPSGGAAEQAAANRVAAVRSGPGWFGNFGGAFVSETLRFAVDELAAAFEAARHDESFWREVHSYDSYVGRPTPLHECAGLSARGGARVWLKREDLSHTGAHKINNALGQALLAKRIGKKKIIAETGAGQHGVAVATVCAKLGLECIVYMGQVDCERQKLNVFRMKTMGATVISVESGGRTLKARFCFFGLHNGIALLTFFWFSGRGQRGDAGVGDERARHALHYWQRAGAASVPAPLPRISKGDWTRGTCPVSGAEPAAARRGRGMHWRRLQRHWHVPSFCGGQGGAAGGGGGGGRGHAYATALRAAVAGHCGRAAWLAEHADAGPGRANHGHALHFGRP